MSRTLLFVVLGLAGLGLYAWSELSGAVSALEVTIGVAAVLVGCLPPAVPAAVTRAGDLLDRLTPRRHAALLAGLAVLLTAHFVVASLRGGRLWVPFIHDEQMYLTQARMFASFRLTVPRHALPDFFDTFYLLVRPVYASMYFPGCALAYVPAVWLHLPWVAWPLAVMDATVLMTYAVAARLLGRLGGLAVAFGLLAVTPMNILPTMTMSHPLGALFGLAGVYAWMRWRERPAWGWAVLCGASLGWMAVTRPLESIAYGLPVGVAVLLAARAVGWRRWATHAGLAVLAAAPFLGLQLAYDKAVTGQWTKLPIKLYVEQEFPGASAMGGPPPKDFKSLSTLPQKQAMFAAFVKPAAEAHVGESFAAGFSWRAKVILLSSLAHPLTVLLLPLCLPLAWADARWRVIVAIGALYALAYTTYPSYLPQYSIQSAPVLVLMTLGGMAWLTTAYAARADPIRSGYLCFTTALALTTLVLSPNQLFAGYEWDQMAMNYTQIPRIITRPAVLFVRFGPGNSPHVEPVYNLEAADPDDARVIRVHDFGAARNLPLLEYYAERQPWREVWQFDRRTRALTKLGNVADVVRTVRSMATTRPTTGPQ